MVWVTVRFTVAGITVLPVVAETVIGTPVASVIFAVVVIARVTFWGPLARLTEGGLNVQVAPVGKPAVQPPAGVDPELKFTVWLKPPSGVTVITVLAGCPAGTLSVVGLADNENGMVTVTVVTAELDPLMVASPS